MHRSNQANRARARPRHPVLIGVIVAAALATVAGLVVLWPGGLEQRPELTTYETTVDARVTQVTLIDCPQEGSSRCRVTDLELMEGPDEGERVTIVTPEAQSFARVDVGDTVVLGRLADAQPGQEYAIVDRQRKAVLLWLFIIFAVMVIALGRLRGVAALASLIVSVAILIVFIVPAILNGSPPLAVAIVGAAAIAFIALYLTHGLTTLSSVALVGTLGGLAVTALLAAVFTELGNLTGLVSDEAFFVQALGIDVDLSGLILGGIVIGGLGVIDDATVTQASAVWELSAVAPDLGRRDLMRRGLRIGSAHVASMVNTLVLAYAGAAMPVVVLLVLSNQAWADVANGEIIATEIIRTLVGSIGLIASVPITTWLATRVRPNAEDLRHAHGELPLLPEVSTEAPGSGAGSTP